MNQIQKMVKADGRMERSRLAALVAALGFAVGLIGCRTPDVAKQPPAQYAPQPPGPRVPTPPTADQISPSSPEAILDGTSTTQTAPPPPAQTPAQPNSSTHHRRRSTGGVERAN